MNPKMLIVKSFKGCGLNNALDGFEDNKIHRFRSDGLIKTGPKCLQQARPVLTLPIKMT